MSDLLRRRAFLLALVAISMFFILGNLDNAYLNIAESNTALLGKNVLQFGYPKAWDGENLVFPQGGVAINDQLAWVAHPWLQYYLAAAGMAVFGQTNFGARVLFALCGVLAVVAIYFLALRASGHVRVAQLATIVLAFNPLFWLYSRQSRYYSTTMLLMILVTLAYLKWRDRPDTRNWLFFVASSIVLFHSLYTIWGLLMLGIGIYYLAFDRKRGNFLGFAAAAVTIGVFTMPWFLYAPFINYELNLAGYGTRLAVHLWKIHTLFYPLLTLLVTLAGAALIRRLAGWRKQDSGVQWRKEYWLFLSLAVYIFSSVLYPFFATHYMLPVLPFGAIIVATLILKIRDYNRWLAAPVLALTLTTNVLHILPYALVDKLHIKAETVEAFMPNPTATHLNGWPLAHYLTEKLEIRFYPFDLYTFVIHDLKHQLKGVVAYLKEHADKDQTVDVPFNDANAVAFYTGMRVVYRFDAPFLQFGPVKDLFRKDDHPDWIIPLPIYEPQNLYDSEAFHQRYEKLKLPYPKEYFETYPNIEFYNFRTNTKAPSWFYILKARTETE